MDDGWMEVMEVMEVMEEQSSSSRVEVCGCSGGSSCGYQLDCSLCDGLTIGCGEVILLKIHLSDLRVARLECRLSQSETAAGHLQEVCCPLISTLFRLQPDNCSNSWMKIEPVTAAASWTAGRSNGPGTLREGQKVPEWLRERACSEEPP